MLPGLRSTRNAEKSANPKMQEVIEDRTLEEIQNKLRMLSFYFLETNPTNRMTIYVRFEVFTVVTMKNAVFRDVV
jgi:hypothetical protein